MTSASNIRSKISDTIWYYKPALMDRLNNLQIISFKMIYNMLWFLPLFGI